MSKRKRQHVELASDLSSSLTDSGSDRRTRKVRSTREQGVVLSALELTASDLGLPDRRTRKARRTAEQDVVPADLESTESGSVLPERRTRKARRTGEHDAVPATLKPTESDSGSDGDSSEVEAWQTTSHRKLSHVKPGILAYPRSAYEGYVHSLPLYSESDALADLEAILWQQNAQARDRPEYDFIVLEEFSAYRVPSDARKPNELAGLEKLQAHRGADVLLFDGVLRVGHCRRYVQGIPFKTITVEGYGDPTVTELSDRVCIQTRLAEWSGVWYQLARPSKEYERFYDPFLWLAEFTKHFVDYLLEVQSVALDDFRFCFYDWLSARHNDKPHFHRWLDKCNLRDFRTTVSAHVSYLWKECRGVETKDIDLRKHPIWAEVDPYNLQAIPEQANCEQKTVVTPFVYDMFKHMYFREQLDARDVGSNQVLRKIHKRKAELGLLPFGLKQSLNTALLTPRSQRSSSPTKASLTISKGDVVCLDADRDGNWKSQSITWYAYVQAVRPNEQAQSTLLDILWLYEPHDTTLGAAYYPFHNELFLSDNCECGRDAIDVCHIKGTVQVSWYAKDPNIQSGLFVRQKFRTAHDEGTDDFVSLQPADFECRCGINHTAFEDCRLRYKIGDTVLVEAHGRKTEEPRLDPALIVDFDLNAERVVLRQFRRERDINATKAANELSLTDVTLTVSPRNVVRKCDVRTFDREVIGTGLPTGYDRGGAGDFYFIQRDSQSSSAASTAVTMSAALPPMVEGVDLVAPPAFKKLTGLGMFCGGGNFDRGLEEGGAVEFKYSVDWAKGAIHSYRANAQVPDNMQCFLGSVNDYLALAMKGSEADFTAVPDEIGLISAGSPCPGFSSLQRDRASDGSLRNASMVASVVSFVDVFDPKYCILENVVNMTAGMGDDKDQNVFAQIIASFVAMGYQVSQLLMDSWSHGSSQSRSRVFIVASAPGLEPFSLPPLTHDHPNTNFRLRALGKASNGRSFGVRRNDYTPFACVSAAEATNDLPDIADGQVRICPSFPDHCMPSEEDAESRGRIAAVPVRPPGMGLANAVRQGLVTGEPLAFFQRSSSVKRGLKSRFYSRVLPNHLLPAVTTVLKLACGFTGQTLHWDQDRSLTVMDLRRAMGFLDHEVIIGSPRQQVHIIGNSVDRKMSFALGLLLRESWSRSCARDISEAEVEIDEALATPLATEDDATDKRSEDGPVNNDSIVFRDMMRAGASAAIALETPERLALRTDEASVASPLQSTGMKVIDLTANSSEDEDEEGDGGPRRTDGVLLNRQTFVDRPTAYVEIPRE